MTGGRVIFELGVVFVVENSLTLVKGFFKLLVKIRIILLIYNDCKKKDKG